MLPLSPEPMRSSTGNSIESVEQPWSIPTPAAVKAASSGARCFVEPRGRVLTSRNSG